MRNVHVYMGCGWFCEGIHFEKKNVSCPKALRTVVLHAVLLSVSIGDRARQKNEIFRDPTSLDCTIKEWVALRGGGGARLTNITPVRCAWNGGN